MRAALAECKWLLAATPLPASACSRPGMGGMYRGGMSVSSSFSVQMAAGCDASACIRLLSPWRGGHLQRRHEREQCFFSANGCWLRSLRLHQLYLMS